MLDAIQYEILNQAGRIIFLVLLPLIVVSATLGVLLAALQTASNIQDSALSYALKLAAVIVVLYLVLPSAVQSLLALAQVAFN